MNQDNSSNQKRKPTKRKASTTQSLAPTGASQTRRAKHVKPNASTHVNTSANRHHKQQVNATRKAGMQKRNSASNAPIQLDRKQANRSKPNATKQNRQAASKKGKSGFKGNSGQQAGLNPSGNKKRESRTNSSSDPVYNSVSLWSANQYSGTSKSNPKKSQKTSPNSSILTRIISVLAAICSFIGKGISTLVQAWLRLIRSNKIAGIISAVVAVLVVFCLVDGITTSGRAYAGVKIGTIDVSGMNEQQMREAIQSNYVDQFKSTTVTVYASDEAAAKTAEAAKQQEDQNAAVAEQLAVEEALSSKQAWQATADSLNGSIDIDKAINEALAIGRENGGFFGRIATQFNGSTVSLSASLDKERLDDFAKEIDSSIGTERVDYDVKIISGYATVSTGNDGWMINRENFGTQILAALMPDGGGDKSFVAHTEYAPLRIDEQAATQAAENINNLLSTGCTITYQNASWQPSASQLGYWIATYVDQSNGAYSLYAYIDGSKANSTAVTELQKAAGSSPSKISFDVNENSVRVITDGQSKIPDATNLAENLTSALFGNGDAVGGTTFATSAPTISTEPVDIPAELSFDEALYNGIIGVVGTYTTEFTTGSGTENRNHNIALVSELLSNSVVKPDGVWSYNDTTGDCDESKGFLGAGAIVAGEYTDSVGGGICQVATTVFNAVYESGLPVVERHNHSLYISSYPQGRDAAVSYGELDLRWENSTESDILVRVSTSSGSVTATLYGIDPGYQVSTETGEWEEGEEYSTTTKVDDSLAPGTRYVKTVGSNGSSIEVTRTVKDSDGNIVRQDIFSSVYDPKNQVIVTGPSS